jgi:hypothetical protein
VTGAKRKEGRGGLGQRGNALGREGRLAHEREERKAGSLAWLGLRKRKREKQAGWAERRKGKGEKGFRVSFFKILFKFIFQTFKL